MSNALIAVLSCTLHVHSSTSCSWTSTLFGACRCLPRLP